MNCEICKTAKVRVNFDHQMLCMDCYNAQLAEDLGIQLVKLPKSFSADDSKGVRRIFEAEQQLTGTHILLTARERHEQGYEFAVDGDLGADPFELFEQLKNKTKRGLATTYIEKGTFADGQPYSYVKDDCLKGVLDYNSENSDLPIVIIDGKPYSWEEVGQMLTAFEGFQVKIVMKDLADELGD